MACNNFIESAFARSWHLTNSKRWPNCTLSKVADTRWRHSYKAILQPSIRLPACARYVTIARVIGSPYFVVVPQTEMEWSAASSTVIFPLAIEASLRVVNCPPHPGFLPSPCSSRSFLLPSTTKGATEREPTPIFCRLVASILRSYFFSLYPVNHSRAHSLF